MNQLLPIIRRKRRPLLPVEVAPVQPPAAKPEPAAKSTEPAVTDAKPKLSDDEASEI